MLRILASLQLVVLIACATNPDDEVLGPDPVGGKADSVADTLTPAQRDTLVHKAATCPFMRTAVNQHAVTVGGTLGQPLGSVADVVALGNAGGGDLGVVLKFFASINHNVVVGPNGATTTPVPAGTFGLWFPGSHGAHPGHSAILMGDPVDVSSGRLSTDRLANLIANYSTVYSDGKHYISREQIGAFIAMNVANDPKSRGFNLAGATALTGQIATLAERAVTGDPNLLDDVLHLFVTSDDLINSSGEFALLFTRFADGADASGAPLVSTDVINSLFRDGVFPAGWDQKPAKALGWVSNTLAIAKSAILAAWGF
jgi:hypothetical protein